MVSTSCQEVRFFIFGLPLRHLNVRLRPAHTASKEFENAALFLRLGLPFTVLIHQENGAFRKRSSNGSYFKTPACRFRVDGKHFGNGAFRKRWCHDNHVISLTTFSSNKTPKRAVIVAFSTSSGVSWTEIFDAFPLSNSSGVVWAGWGAQRGDLQQQQQQQGLIEL